MSRLITQTFLFISLILAAATGFTQVEPPVQVGAETVGGLVVPAIIQVDAANLPTPHQWQPGDPIREIPRRLIREKGVEIPDPDPRGYGFDALAELQNASGSSTRGGAGIETTIINQDGGDFTGVNPADTVGDVGIDFYVQMINTAGAGSEVLIIEKATGNQAAFFNITDLAAGSGTGCAAGSGDPIVIFDQAAAGGQGRWLLSEFTGSSICVYISQTTDPTAGTWFVYEFDSVSGGLPDYFKIGAWPDAYYTGANEGFQGGRSNYAFDRVNMLLGNPARPLQVFSSGTLSGFGFQLLQPADFDGLNPPPPGAPGIFMRHNDDESHAPDCAVTGMDCLEYWEFSVDFDNSANSSFVGPIQIPIAEIDSNLCGLTAFACASQPGSATTLDPLREPVMWRPQYRNNGSTQQIAGSLVTDVDGTDRHGVRWFILERPAGTAAGGWALQQEGTFSPDATNRWMSSIAQDSAGNLAIGYNASSADTGVFPSMRYAGRLNGDPAGLLPQGEFSIIEGTSPNGSNRYGDYSALVVDPIDDCTFWYTAQYNVATGWDTRIASFRFNACGSPGFALSGTPLNQQVCSPGDLTDININTVSVAGFTNPITLVLNGEPAGTIGTFTPNPVTPGDPSIAAIGLPGGVAAGMASFTIDGTATGADPRSLTVNLDVFDAIPGTPTLDMPVDGGIDVGIPVTLSWTAAAQSNDFFIELALDASFNNIIYTATETATSHVVGAALDPLTTYFWRVAANNPCGAGVMSAVSSFTTADIPPILLVDDDDNGPDTRSFYETTLNNLGLAFDVFDTNNSDNEPGAGQLAAYDTVIWFSGDEFGGFAGPGPAGETALADYLTNGGCLFISSQDYFFDRGAVTPFMLDFLGLGDSPGTDLGDYVSVTGTAGPLFDGLGPYTLDFTAVGGNDFTDNFIAAADAQLNMIGDNGNGASVGRPEFNAVYLAYPFETMSEADREEMLQVYLDSCDVSLGEVFFMNGFEDADTR